MTYDWIEHLKTYNSLRGSNVYINEKYDKAFDYTTISNLIKNTMLYGSYRGNDNYCQPYMTKKEFDTLQDALKKNVRFRTTNHIHLFTKMVKCPYCGQNLIGFNSRYISKKTGKTTISYMLRWRKTGIDPIKRTIHANLSTAYTNMKSKIILFKI